MMAMLRYVFILFSLSLLFCNQPYGLVNKLDTNQKIVFLTFDDGPHPAVTQKILDILASENIKAVFFMIGNNMIQYPDIVEKIYLSGHDIANHSFNHTRLDNLFGDNLTYEIEETNKTYKDILGITPHFFRPPGGRFNNMIYELIRKNNLIPIGWEINTGDYLDNNKKQINSVELEAKVKQVLNKVYSNLKPGAIILMHNGNDICIQSLPLVIKYVKEKGYQFKKLSDYI